MTFKFDYELVRRMVTGFFCVLLAAWVIWKGRHYEEESLGYVGLVGPIMCAMTSFSLVATGVSFVFGRGGVQEE